MFTDMVGYTSLAQKDEALAVELLEEHRTLVRPTFRRHGGRIVGIAGDAFVVEFPSVLEAVLCAADIQSKLTKRNDEVPHEREFLLRIGIHLGDVIHKGKNVSGDAVNVASRIEPLAPAGGVCVTAEVYHSVANKVNYEFESIGSPPLKNVATPIEVFRITNFGRAVQAISSQPASLPRNRIAVLPFVNMSPDPNDEYFADGMTEELIAVLSRTKDLGVIARTSVMVYKGRSRKISEIGRELSVSKIVEGSVRKAGDKVRLTVQLVDAQTEDHLWARSYDKELKDIFEIQSDIARRVGRALRVRLASEASSKLGRQVVKSDAYILFLKGMQFRNKATEEGWRKAIEFFGAAISTEPDFADAIAALSICHCWLAYFAFEPPGEGYEEAKKLAMSALKISDVAEAHLSLFWVSFYHEAKWEEAEQELRRALELNPSSAEARNYYSFWLANFGRTEDAIVEAERALELDPLSELSHVVTADVYAWVGKYDMAISKFKAVLDINPKLPIAHNDLGIAYLAMGKIREGVEELERSRELSEGTPFFKVNLAYGYAISGRRDEAFRIADELKELYNKRVLPAYFLSVVYAGLGEKQEALSWLEKAHDDRAIIFTPLLHIEPELASLRDEPRFKALLAKLGLTM
jgi:TolB-like protein/Tfp pilus assembly protein PilF